MNYQYHGSRYLVELWYRVPQIDLRMMIIEDPSLGKKDPNTQINLINPYKL